MTLVINLYGGPGTGKSTMAAAIFSELKFMNINAELVQEFAKELVWENRLDTFDDELYVFAKQSHRLQRLSYKVDVIVTDSPLLMKLNYIKDNDINFKNLVLDEYYKYDNIDIFLNRVKPYNPNGRYQNESDALNLDYKIRNILIDNSFGFFRIDSVKSKVDIILKIILIELGMED